MYKYRPKLQRKSVFLRNLILNIYNDYDKIYIYSPSLHQDLYQKLIKCLTNFIPFNIIPKILNKEDINIVIDEIVNNKDFQKSETEIETYESIEDLKIPPEHDKNSIIILDDLNKKNGRSESSRNAQTI